MQRELVKIHSGKGGCKVSETRRDKIFLAFVYIILWVFLIIVLYPLIYIISASISDPTYVSGGEMLLFPKGITFEGYKRVFANPDIWLGYRNTLFYSIFGSFLGLVIIIPAAYALSRQDLIGRKYISFFFLFTMFFNGGLIPTFLLIKDLNLYNTIWAILLPATASVWNLIVSRTFFQTTIPRTLEEAAEIDGCSTFMLFFKIILPLSKPILAVMALFYGVGRWNSYFSELIYFKSRDLYPLQIFLREILITAEMSTSNAYIAGAADLALAEQQRIADIVKYSIMIVSTLPIICVYPFVQKFFIKGVMIGSIKG